jgi:uncharacterized protein (TIGR02996 family)
MNTQEALLQAIWNDPDDDTPRLVYADFLEETGREEEVARAQYIRRCIQVNNQVYPFKAYELATEAYELGKEAGKLWKKYQKKWMRGLPSWVCDEPVILQVTGREEPKRGFLSTIKCSARDFLQHGKVILKAEPVVQIRLTELYFRDAEKLASNSVLNRLRNLYFEIDRDHRDIEDIETVLNSPHLKNLHTLGFHDGNAECSTVEVISTRAHFTSLRHLVIECSYEGTEVWRTLAESPILRQLKSLWLSGSATDEAAILLAKSPILKGVREFQFSVGHDDDSPGEKGIRALARSPYLTDLQKLSLSPNNEENALKGLSRGTNWTQLQELDLDIGEISDETISHIPPDRFPSVQKLSLHLNPIQGISMCPLIQSLCRRGLKVLDCSHNLIDDEGLIHWAKGDFKPSLEVLNLASNKFTSKGIKPFLDSPAHKNLKILELSKNSIGNEGAISISKSAYLTSLESLSLEECGITGKGLVALASSPNLEKLLHLDLKKNKFGIEAIRALAESKYLKQLRRLELDKTALNDDCAYILGKSRSLTNLRYLHVWGNQFSEKAKKVLKKRFNTDL